MKIYLQHFVLLLIGCVASVQIAIADDASLPAYICNEDRKAGFGYSEANGWQDRHYRADETYILRLTWRKTTGKMSVIGRI